MPPSSNQSTFLPEDGASWFLWNNDHFLTDLLLSSLEQVSYFLNEGSRSPWNCGNVLLTWCLHLQGRFLLPWRWSSLVTPQPVQTWWQREKSYLCQEWGLDHQNALQDVTPCSLVNVCRCVPATRYLRLRPRKWRAEQVSLQANFLLIFGRPSVPISTGTPAMMTKVFRGIRQSLHKNSGTESRRFILNPSKFIIHHSYHPKLYSLLNKPQINIVICRPVAGNDSEIRKYTIVNSNKTMRFSVAFVSRC